MPDQIQVIEGGAGGPAPDPRTDVAHPARMYDYFLGGKDNFEVDREAADLAMSVVPDARRVALTNREFLVRAVQLMALHKIDQFADLGTGFPTSPNVHEVARARHPHARVVYVDNDPVVVTHSCALRKAKGVVAIDGDIRQPDTILSNPELVETIDLTRPVGMLFVAVLHFIPDLSRAAAIVTSFLSRMAPGSMLAISHITSDNMPEAAMHTIQAAYADATAPVVFRSKAEIRALFAGLPLKSPGLVEVSRWRPELSTTRVKSTLRFLGGVAQVPEQWAALAPSAVA